MLFFFSEGGGGGCVCVFVICHVFAVSLTGCV